MSFNMLLNIISTMLFFGGGWFPPGNLHKYMPPNNDVMSLPFFNSAKRFKIASKVKARTSCWKLNFYVTRCSLHNCNEIKNNVDSYIVINKWVAHAVSSHFRSYRTSPWKIWRSPFYLESIHFRDPKKGFIKKPLNFFRGR